MQIRILPIADKHKEYSEKLKKQLEDLDLKVELDEREEKIGYKIDKKKIVLDDAISSLGYHEVKINLHKNVIGIVTVELIK